MNPRPRLLLALMALACFASVAGALFATWGVHVPSIKAHYALGEQSLAIAMLGFKQIKESTEQPTLTNVSA